MPSLTRRRLRAPQDNDAALIDPPLAEATKIIARNRRIGAEFDRLGVLPPDHRTLARLALLTTAGGQSKRR